MSTNSMPEISSDSTANAFIYWQCQIRKYSVRNLQARPTSGICPELFVDNNSLGVITTLLVPEHPGQDVSHLKYIYQKTLDSKERRENAVKYLQSDFYQFPNAFSGELTALAAKGAAWIDQLANADKIELLFDQDSKQWKFECVIELLKSEDVNWQFTLVHNRLFNHTLTTNIEVIAFKPVW